uniref:Thioredoxin n=1 Tax=uncultured Thiotrichaceae bacterium TaxID=298394 RepID=A0A6S6SJ32_9GAMM|nr:MAG: FIG000875: Thioredoxin domain-containing protein EC-YbbN [uncultured Thiotrichaceae bacterium]
MSDSPFIFEADAQSFAQVLQHSHQVPVLVDFWADWCEPCKMLMPVLAKLADEYQGGFILVKVNSDENQELAAQFGVRSLPTIKLFKGGEAVDEFTGVLPEEKIRSFINKHRTRQTEPYRQQALEMQQAGDLDGAVDLMAQVIQHEPDFYEASLELAGMLVTQGRIDDADALVQTVPDTDEFAPQVKQLQTDIKMARLKEAASGEDTSELEQKLADNPDDLATMLELAKVRLAQGNSEEALELYLTVMKKDPAFEEGAGRQGLIDTFELLGNANPLVKTYRGKMFSLLY